MTTFRCRVEETRLRERSNGESCDFKIKATPIEKMEQRDETASTRSFSITVHASNSLLHCGGWMNTDGNDRVKQYLAFVQEWLEHKGLPADGEQREENLFSDTDERRFASGPVFDGKNVTEEWDLEVGDGPMGFARG